MHGSMNVKPFKTLCAKQVYLKQGVLEKSATLRGNFY